MRLLFEIDTKDYDPSDKAFVRPSVRSIIIRDGKVAMVYSKKYDYYKFPGGGIEAGESFIDALVRETLEEVGLVIIPESIRDYGYVHRVQKSYFEDFELFVQDNYYYLCSAQNDTGVQNLNGYEADEGFTLKFITPEEAIRVNRTKNHGHKDLNMIEREARVLEILMKENIFKAAE